jgi:hypothetical protein
MSRPLTTVAAAMVAFIAGNHLALRIHQHLPLVTPAFAFIVTPEWPAVVEPTMDELPEWYRFRNELDACLDDMDPEFPE